MSADKPVKIDVLYGVNCVHPEYTIRVCVDPRTRLQKVGDLMMELWAEVILPAALFAMVLTALTALEIVARIIH